MVAVSIRKQRWKKHNSSEHHEITDGKSDKKLDLSYHEMDDSSLAVNLQDFSNHRDR